MNWIATNNCFLMCGVFSAVFAVHLQYRADRTSSNYLRGSKWVLVRNAGHREASLPSPFCKAAGQWARRTATEFPSIRPRECWQWFPPRKQTVRVGHREFVKLNVTKYDWLLGCGDLRAYQPLLCHTLSAWRALHRGTRSRFALRRLLLQCRSVVHRRLWTRLPEHSLRSLLGYI